MLSSSRDILKADGDDLAYITVSVVDKDGNVCPDDSRMLNFKVTGQGEYRASANGDATCLDLFHLPRMHAFKGRLTTIVQSGDTPGNVTLQVSAPGLKPARITIPVK